MTFPIHSLFYYCSLPLVIYASKNAANTLCLQTEEYHRNFSEDTWFRSRHSNPGPPEDEAGMITIAQPCSGLCQSMDLLGVRYDVFCTGPLRFINPMSRGLPEANSRSASQNV
jgi:hypothetical protein